MGRGNEEKSFVMISSNKKEGKIGWTAILAIFAGFIGLLAFLKVAGFWDKIFEWFKGPKKKGPRKYTIINPDGTEDEFNPMPLATELYDTMSGILDWTEAKEGAWRKLYLLPKDSQVELVYNVFNYEYGNGNTLTQWILGEYGAFVDSYKHKALDRLGQLGLN